jgi:Xaa-Pro aminopeptidase
MNIPTIQNVMQQEKIDSWVIYDFQGKNPILGYFLQTTFMTTRRVFLVIPAVGEPTLLGSKIDHDALYQSPYRQIYYAGWREMEAQLQQLLAGSQTVAMDYSPNGELPTVSRTDAGTVERIRSWGKKVVSAANVFQAAVALWGPGVLEAHLEDCQRVAEIKDEAFYFIGDRLRRGQPVTEYEAQALIMRRFAETGLTTPYPVVVAVNQNSSDPHYTPHAERHAPINIGDWVLIDLWAKRPGHDYVYADMTWVAYAGATPSAKQQELFRVVAQARDAAVAFVQQNVSQGQTLAGWQVDDVARNIIAQAGYGEYFFHRTGHSLGPGDHVHGPGANIDNLETHDTRQLIPGIGFSVEPGIYLPEFGLRLEIDVFMEATGPRVTTPIQQEIICLSL